MNQLSSNTETGNSKLSRYAATQGMVLLENNNNALPIKTKTIALFGGGAYATVKGGTGSGNVSNSYEISIYQGFLNAGYTVTTTKWIENFGSYYDNIQSEDTTLTMLQKLWSGEKVIVTDPLLKEEDIIEATAADTAIYIISRNSGEGEDRSASKGDYYLSDTEVSNLRLMADNFKTSIVVLNTCIIDLNFFKEIEGLDAILVMSQAGMEGGAALVEVLNGTMVPSGKLTDTWAINYEDYPASKTFSKNNGDSIQKNYEEGIYVGYRYFDSFNITPMYEFGYGLSYTDFDIEVKNVSVNGENITVQALVTNVGTTYSGKEVVQIYFSAPSGELDKPYQQLIAFGKTKELTPKESQTLKITFPIEEMASYSEVLAARILEAGDYLIRVGNSSRNTKIVAVIRLDETKIIEQLSNKLPLDQNFKDLSSLGQISYSYEAEKAELVTAPVILIKALSMTVKNSASLYDSSVITYLVEGSDYTSPFKPDSIMALDEYTEKFEFVRACPESKLFDVYCGKITMEEFIAQLDVETLATLVNGKDSESTHTVDVKHPILGAKPSPGKASGATTSNYVNSYGIPNTILADGPAGLHIPPLVSEEVALPVDFFGANSKAHKKDEHPMPQFNADCTAFPVGLSLAQSWDMELIKSVGEAYGREMLEKFVSVTLAPGMNIHRDPLCGRNFEYFSEDPLITGMAGTMFTLGLQSLPGIGVSIKHFAANNQEADRNQSNSSLSERALREIYLKGFEMVVKSAQPMTVMSSYNKINGIHTSSNYDLLTHILRGEWGFKGYVMTDWGSESNKAQDMHAGNDLIMGGSPISILINAVKALKPIFNEDGSINVTTIVLYGGFQTLYIENWNSFIVQKDGKDTCITTVAENVAISEKVFTMVEEKKAIITENPDRTKTVTYYGNDLGAYITLGDLQKSAMNLLKVLLKSWNVRYIYNNETGYEPIDIKPYSSGFESLKTYFVVQ